MCEKTAEILNRLSGNLILVSLTKLYPDSIFVYFWHVQQLLYTNYMRFCTPVFIGIGNIFNWAKTGVRTNLTRVF